MINVQDAFYEFVEKTNKRLVDKGIVVYPICANIKEICARLTNKDKSPVQREQKYPGIFLLKDFTENYTRTMTQVEVPLQILIVTDSRLDYTSEERQDLVYNPVLYPICEAFLETVKPYLYGKIDSLSFSKTDRDFISGAFQEAINQNNEENLFNDQLDGIELKLRLVLRKKC